MTDEIKELKRKAILYGFYDENEDVTFTDEGVMLSSNGGVLIPDELMSPMGGGVEAFADMLDVYSALGDKAWEYLRREDETEVK